MSNHTVDLAIPTAFGLEAVVARELKALGCGKSTAENGRVAISADIADIPRLNLQLRSGERVLLKLGEFEARDFDQLFDGVKALPWVDWLPVDAAFPVTGKSIRSQLTHVPSCQSIVKKAVVESLQQRWNRPRFEESGALFPIEFSLVNNVVQVCLNTSGPGLHKRGYRTAGGSAPLKETLAAGLVQLCFWNADRPFWDPFCGTGTIAIEAALRARNIAPGVNRTFVSEAWPAIPLDAWTNAREAARDQAIDSLPSRLNATDIDFRATRSARENAANAGVLDDLHIETQPLESISSRRKFGCIVTNPPYGERLEEEVGPLYQQMAEVFDRLPEWSYFVLTARKEFEADMGRKSDRRRKLYNARIECTYYQYHGPKPPWGDPKQA